MYFLLIFHKFDQENPLSLVCQNQFRVSGATIDPPVSFSAPRQLNRRWNDDIGISSKRQKRRQRQQ